MVVVKFLVFVSQVVSIFSKILTWIIGGAKGYLCLTNSIIGGRVPRLPPKSTPMAPTDLKISKITPIFKAGHKNLITSYRPILVLPFFSKIMEKLMANRLTEYISKYVPISVTQYGFQRGLSTYMALMDMQTNIGEAMNQIKFSLGVFFDISKAFDTVNHKLLIKKLEYFGIRGIAKSWFEDYLSQRTQYVFLSGFPLRPLLSLVASLRDLYLDLYYFYFILMI